MNAEQLLAVMRDGAYVVERYRRHLDGVITIRVLVRPDGTEARVQDSTIDALIGKRRVCCTVHSSGTIPPLLKYTYRNFAKDAPLPTQQQSDTAAPAFQTDLPE